MVIRGFFNDGMFVLKWIYQVVARVFVQFGIFGFMTPKGEFIYVPKGCLVDLGCEALGY